MAQSIRVPIYRKRLSESHEAHDSQAILDALKAEFGLATVQHLQVRIDESGCINGDGASGPACISSESGFLRSARPAVGREISNPQPPGAVVVVADSNAGDDIQLRIHDRNRTQTHLRDSVMRAVGPDDAAILQRGPSPQRENMMEVGLASALEGSPTQMNTIRRDCSDDLAIIGSSQLEYGSLADTQEGGELRALQADDTGAVNFGDLSPAARVSSQVSEDAGFENTRSGWRSHGAASQHAPNGDNNDNTPGFNSRGLPPETPGLLSRNPFGTDREASRIPLAGSQLFRETQLLTSAAKHSPTMSRPSPHMLYEMVSPNMEPFSLKKRAAGVSSPVQGRETPVLGGDGGSRDKRGLHRDDLALESPTVKLMKPSRARQPLAHYEPMKRSQERKATGAAAAAAAEPISLGSENGNGNGNGNGNESESDDDAFLVLERRRRIVEKKKAQAAKELERVSVVRPGHREAGTSPGRKRRKLNFNGTHGTGGLETIPPRESPKRPTLPLEIPESAPARGLARAIADEERIPATSPAPSISMAAGVRRDATIASELSPATREALHELGDLEDDLLPPSSDLPLVRRRPRRSYGKRPTVYSSSPGDPTPLLHLHPATASQAVTVLSTVSTLTPAPSSDSTPVATAVPASPRRPRASRPPAMNLDGLPVSADSVDELQRSPASVTSKPSKALTRTFRQTVSGSASHLPRGRRLFEGMAFAISMQAEQDLSHRAALEKRITQAGGTILEDGFQGLFEASPAMSTRRQTIEHEDALKLVQSSSEFGFTALIGDGHSRKPKYMQALALGLPCLAYQWIAACLSKGELAEWEPYLLAAGSSAALGDAIRSRCLTPYPAVGARLGEIISQRPRLLAGQSMLLVAKGGARSRNEKGYIFLALALGPSVYRVPTAKEAYETLSAHEKAGDAFDWIYVDESIGTVESVFSVEDRPAGRKRKKTTSTTTTTATPSRVRNTRVLSNELVIQSLISGRMIGEDEISL